MNSLVNFILSQNPSTVCWWQAGKRSLSGLALYRLLARPRLPLTRSWASGCWRRFPRLIASLMLDSPGRYRVQLWFCVTFRTFITAPPFSERVGTCSARVQASRKFRIQILLQRWRRSRCLSEINRLDVSRCCGKWWAEPLPWNARRQYNSGNVHTFPRSDGPLLFMTFLAVSNRFSNLRPFSLYTWKSEKYVDFRNIRSKGSVT